MAETLLLGSEHDRRCRRTRAFGCVRWRSAARPKPSGSEHAGASVVREPTACRSRLGRRSPAPRRWLIYAPRADSVNMVVVRTSFDCGVWSLTLTAVWPRRDRLAQLWFSSCVLASSGFGGGAVIAGAGGGGAAQAPSPARTAQAARMRRLLDIWGVLLVFAGARVTARITVADSLENAVRSTLICGAQ